MVPKKTLKKHNLIEKVHDRFSSVLVETISLEPNSTYTGQWVDTNGHSTVVVRTSSWDGGEHQLINEVCHELDTQTMASSVMRSDDTMNVCMWNLVDRYHRVKVTNTGQGNITNMNLSVEYLSLDNNQLILR